MLPRKLSSVVVEWFVEGEFPRRGGKEEYDYMNPSTGSYTQIVFRGGGESQPSTCTACCRLRSALALLTADMAWLKACSRASGPAACRMWAITS